MEETRERSRLGWALSFVSPGDEKHGMHGFDKLPVNLLFYWSFNSLFLLTADILFVQNASGFCFSLKLWKNIKQSKSVCNLHFQSTVSCYILFERCLPSELMSQGSGIPSFTANAQWQTARMDRDLQTFSTGFTEQSIYHRPGRAVPRLLTATQDADRAANRGKAWRLMARWSSIMTNPTWWFSDGAAGLLQECQWCWRSSVTLPVRVTGKTCEWHHYILGMFCGVWMIWSALCWSAVNRQWPSSGSDPR